MQRGKLLQISEGEIVPLERRNTVVLADKLALRPTWNFLDCH